MFTLNGRGKLLAAGKPLVMGIINSTPDSFYGGSRISDGTALLQQAEAMLREGADILDIGGQSTRPGAGSVGVEEELRRVIPHLSLLREHFPDAFLSVDTWFARVAREAISAGASMVNDVSGGLHDREMLDTVGRLGVPYVCMHMKGTPSTMHNDAVYEDVTREVLDFFIRRAEDCR